MIKKFFMPVFTFLLFTLSSHATSISMIGDALSGWGTDVAMTSTDGVHFTLSNYTFTGGSAKFRQDASWDRNWGASNFPSGTGTSGGNNIGVLAGTYNVAFNLDTKAYSFTSTVVYDAISISGTAGPGLNSDVSMNTGDGIHYSVSQYTLKSGTLIFRKDNSSTTTWGSASFPTGTATQGGSNVSVSPGTYDITFNKTTGVYSFDFATVGIIGSGTAGGWNTDTLMSTTDGENYTLSAAVITKGEMKFRQNQSWSVNWGSKGFPAGTANLNGDNIPVSAGTYFISFNSKTGVYHIYDEVNLQVASIVSLCKGSVASFLSGSVSAVPGSVLKWYTVSTGGSASLTSPKPVTSILGTNTYYVSQTIGNTEGSRVSITVTVYALPTEVLGAITSTTEVTATPGTYVAAVKAVGPYVNTTTTVSYRVPAFTAGLTYYWTVPAGVSIVGQADGVTSVTQEGVNANILNVNFKNISSALGAAGSITVQAQNAGGCKTTAKASVALTKALPTAPAAIVMTDALTVSATTGLPTAVTSFAKYMGRTTELTLTATAAATATSYVWELPTGVNITQGSATTVNGVTSSTSNVITVNLSGVTSSNTYNYSTTAAVPVSTNVVRIGVKSRNDVGNSSTSNVALLDPATDSTARLLTLKAIAPATPGAITASTANVCSVVGTSTNVTYSVASVTNAYANGYTWNVPTGASIVGSATGNSISVSYTSEYVAAGAVTVTSSNGVGTSAAKSLTIARAVPAAIATISGGTTYSTCDQTFSIASVANQTYTWTVPVGATIKSGIGTNSVVVNYGSLAGSQTIKVMTTNSCGLSSAVKSATLTKGSCPVVSNARLSQTSNVSVTGMYPNPTSDSFHLELSATKSADVSVTVYSFEGIVVSTKNVQLSEGTNVLNENLSSQRNGIYLVKIIDSITGLETIKKIIKQ